MHFFLWHCLSRILYRSGHFLFTLRHLLLYLRSRFLHHFHLWHCLSRILSRSDHSRFFLRILFNWCLFRSSPFYFFLWHDAVRVLFRGGTFLLLLWYLLIRVLFSIGSTGHSLVSLLHGWLFLLGGIFRFFNIFFYFFVFFLCFLFLVFQNLHLRFHPRLLLHHLRLKCFFMLPFHLEQIKNPCYRDKLLRVVAKTSISGKDAPDCIKNHHLVDSSHPALVRPELYQNQKHFCVVPHEN